MTQADYNITNQIDETEEELDFENFVPDENEDNIDTGNEGTNQEDSGTSGPENSNQQTNELRIRIRNAQGEEKELIIRYNE